MKTFSKKYSCAAGIMYRALQYSSFFMLILLFFSLGIKAQAQTSEKSIRQLIKAADKTFENDFATALSYCHIALDKAVAIDNPDSIFLVQREIGVIYDEKGQLENALEMLKNAEITAQKLGNFDKLSIYNDLAIIHRKLGNFNEAKEYFNMNLILAQKSEDWEMLEDTYHGLGNLYKTIGEHEKALDGFLQSLRVAQNRKSPTGIIISLKDLSEIYLKLKQEKNALEHIQKAYHLATQEYNSILKTNRKSRTEEYALRLATIIDDYGKILIQTNKPDSALTYYQEALNLYKLYEAKSRSIIALTNLAEAHRHLKQYAEAERYLMEALIYKSTAEPFELANLYHGLGIFYQERHAFNKAEKFFLQSLSVASAPEKAKKDKRLIEIQQKNNRKLYELYKSQKDFRKATLFLAQTDNLNDTIYQEENTRHLAELQFRFDIEKGEKEIQALKLRENRLFLIGIFAVLSFLMAFMGYSIWLGGRNNRELKRKNNEIELQNKRLEESNEVLQQFAYASAHDLKEPLRTIGSFVSLLQRKYGKEFNEDAHEYMGFVSKGVKRMNSLLEDLLIYSNVISQYPTSEELDLNDILSNVTYSLQSTIDQKEAIIEYPNKMPTLRMNSLHLTQIIQNLLTNALKFNERTPHIIVDYSSNDENFILSIKDNGIGIKKEYENKVFNLFHQLQRHQYEGTGIGLTICKNIVEKYKGNIWFESKEGEGTTFFVALPLIYVVHIPIQDKMIENTNLQDSLAK